MQKKNEKLGKVFGFWGIVVFGLQIGVFDLFSVFHCG
jgi:hypothetical protein